jgi:hypothetical protein
MDRMWLRLLDTPTVPFDPAPDGSARGEGTWSVTVPPQLGAGFAVATAPLKFRSFGDRGATMRKWLVLVLAMVRLAILAPAMTEDEAAALQAEVTRFAGEK